MAKKHESELNIEDLTDAEVYVAIRYLEPDPRSANQQNNDAASAICVSLVILLLGYLGFLWLYR
jgi:hypothetical protein